MSFFYYSKWGGQNCLTIVFPLEFRLDDKEFSCVVYGRKGPDLTGYSITILDEEGEEVLPEPFRLVEKDGSLGREPLSPQDEWASLKNASAIALEIYLSQHTSCEAWERVIA